MLDNQPDLEAWMNGGEVQRFHQWPMVHRQQTVAEHTFNMLMISTHLYAPTEQNSPTSIANSEKVDWCNDDMISEFLALQQAILFHDVAEGRRGTSDVSSWAKRRMPKVKEIIDVVEKQIAKDFGYLEWVEKYSDLNNHRLKVCDKLELMWTVISQLMLGNTTLFDASWPVITEMVAGLQPRMEINEAKLIKEWYDRAIEIRG